ncbi:hypothetical protein [Myxococcus qinghaiensis]|uniref:hypothetical protein n=1 Tax=Myxococcus qinghaiensis TaxID=2906758 RepID=UPI0020A7FA62|nr:hypothetical protein [Myxococcus qinghaiensis]MCP3166454.1 hypothetical protein [Myxococcus qinghaiensis]
MASMRLAAMEARVDQLVEALLQEPPSLEPVSPRVEPPWTRERLRPVVHRVAARGVLTLDDVRLYVGLAQTLGVDFEEQRPHAWMRAWLDDTAVSEPTARLHRVVRERRRREDVALRNQRKAEAFRLRHAPSGKDT